jgi:hypothetical protein
MQKIAKSKKRLSFFIRSLVSIGLIYYVFHRVSLHVLFQTFKEANIHYLILSFCITPVLIFISSWKWKVILKALKIHVSIFKLFWLYVVGYFFNTVLPTNVGGDVVRAYSLGKSTNQNAKAFSSVFIERFTGLTALLFMAILAFFIAIRNFWDLKLSIALILCLVGYIFILFFLLNKSIIRRIQKVPIRFLKVVFNKVLKFQEAILSLRHEKAALVFAIFNSFLFYFVAVLNVYVSSLAFNASLSFFDALLITPIVLVITMIPISIGGIGLAEYAYFFTSGIGWCRWTVCCTFYACKGIGGRFDRGYLLFFNGYQDRAG